LTNYSLNINFKAMTTKAKERKYEVDNLTGTNHEGTLANQPVQRLTATSIIGDNVENGEGENLGEIDNLMINVHTGYVEYAVVEFGSFLGLGGKLFAIPFKELRINPAKKRVLATPPLNSVAGDESSAASRVLLTANPLLLHEQGHARAEG